MKPLSLLGLALAMLVTACSSGPASSTEVAGTTQPAQTQISIFPGKEVAGQNISLLPGGDADTQIVEKCETANLRQTGNGQALDADPANQTEDYYIQFNVDNAVLFSAQPTTNIRLEIEYCDQGTDSFTVQYDALTGGQYGDGRFLESLPLQKTNTQRIQTASFIFEDANFADRDNGADFRISDMSDGAEAILSITITLLPANQGSAATPSSQATSASGQPADLIFFNGSVLTMEDGLPVKQAIAIAGDLILQVGNDEEILALGGPETKLIDLQGHTLMPGFIDAHTHILTDSSRNLGISLREAQQLAFRNGITTIAEAFITPEFLAEFQALDAAGQLQLRISLYLIYTDNCGNLMGDWWKDHPPTHNFGEMLRINGIKIFLDGGSCGLPATSVEYYKGQGLGKLFLSQQQLNAAVAEAQSLNYQVLMHAFGDRAVEEGLNAIEAALKGEPNSLRHRIDHNAVIAPEDLPRYGQIGVVTAIFGYFPVCSYTATDPFFQQNEWPWRDLLDANPGLHVAFHGDDPWMPPMYPILDLYGMVTRRGILNIAPPQALAATAVSSDSSICEPPPWLLDQRITVEEALPMMTTGSAYALFRETEVGSLEPNKLADLIILSANPLEVDANEIKDIELWMTMVGGQTVYCLPGSEAYCP